MSVPTEPPAHLTPFAEDCEQCGPTHAKWVEACDALEAAQKAADTAWQRWRYTAQTHHHVWKESRPNLAASGRTAGAETGAFQPSG